MSLRSWSARMVSSAPARWRRSCTWPRFCRWPSHHRRAIRYAKGRVLDAGAGAGRVSLHLQERGHDVVAIDNSPGAIDVCRRRGVRDARVLAFDAVDESLGTFDTIVLFGNNFGLFGSPTKAKRLLRRLHRMTSGRRLHHRRVPRCRASRRRREWSGRSLSRTASSLSTYARQNPPGPRTRRSRSPARRDRRRRWRATPRAT
ncbi:MAG: class I SAM-dependent methyltransferase, partial [Gaiellaceae bacterium]